jgi:hypothetical protein
MPFDEPFGHELTAEWLKALSVAEGLRVDTERRFLPRFEIGVCLRPELRPRVRRRMYQSKKNVLGARRAGS